jgi:arginyl-tRNA synthetase
MHTPRHRAHQWLYPAFKTIIPHLPPSQLTIHPCTRPEHGDYQCNLALSLAKTTGQNPRTIAQTIIATLPPNPAFHPPQIAGPGFINLHLNPDTLPHTLNAILHHPRLGIPPTPTPKRIVIDFSSPNVAKEMHVGHIRSTILGDALARILSFLGHTVIRDNHLGDWGTQFGKILLAYKRHGSPLLLHQNPIAHLEDLYQNITQAEKNDPALAQAARDELVKLQKGDPENLALWQSFCQETRRALDAIYARLNVHFDHTLGESFYNPWLQEIVQELLHLGIAKESQGAICIFFHQHPQLADKPMLIQKSDEGYLYATTDLATLRYRLEHWHADEILYITDGRQQLHFQQLFEAARLWRKEPVTLRHIWFGSILGQDKKPLKTREGRPIKLRDLLDEAEARALAIIRQKRPDFSPQQQTHAAHIIGIGALKYADLAQNRNLDYIFNWDKLLAFDGNTAPYLQNAYVRIASIFRKAQIPPTATPPIQQLSHPQEIALAKKLLTYGDAIEEVVQDYRPHILCTYLYELATTFHQFYEACPVLNTPEPTRATRLSLCALTSATLAHGLSLLGIGILEEM